MTTARVDAYGDPLPPFALARFGTLRWRHRGLGVDDLTFSADGRTLYSTGSGVTAFDVATGLPRWSSRVRASYAALLPHPEGDRLVTVGLGGELCLLDAATGALLATRPQPSNSLCTVGVSHDASTLLAGGFHPFGALFDRDGTTRATLPIDRGSYLHSASFSPDDATVVTTDCDGGVVLWSVAEAKAIRSFGRDLNPNDAVFTPDGQRLVVASSSGHIAVFEVSTGAQLGRWKAHKASASSLAVTPDGERVVSIGEDSSLSLWRLDDHSRLATLSLRQASPALCLSPDGASVAVADGARVAIVDLATFADRTPSAELSLSLGTLALSRDGETLVTFTGFGEARWWSMSGASAPSTSAGTPHIVALRRLPGEGDRYAVMPPLAEGTCVLDLDTRAFTMRPERWTDTHQKWWGRAVEAKLFQGKLALTNARGETRSLKVNSHLLAITPDDRHAVFLERSKLTVWDLDQHAEVAVVAARSARDFALSPRGDEAVVWTGTTVQRVGIPGGEVRAEWRSPEPIAAAAYSPDGRRLAVATELGTSVLDCARNEEVARVEGTATTPTALLFDRDGSRVVTAAWDSTAVSWSVDEAIAGYVPAPAKKKAGKRKG